MRVGILVNVMGSANSGQTTVRLARRLVAEGHDVWFTSPGNFALDADGHVRIRARGARSRRCRSTEALLAELNRGDLRSEWVDADDLDVALLRNNPFALKHWAGAAGLDLGQLLVGRGVIVLNDPIGLSKAANKLYLQGFPEQVRPRAVITRSLSKIADFLEEEGTIILKPLEGFGGKGVFKVSRGDRANLERIVRAISRDGYVVAQEFLLGASQGDTRLFLMNGVPLVQGGRAAVVRRIRTGDDIRSNIHSGGRIRRGRMNDALLRVAETVRPKLIEDGMFFVGLDVVGEKLLEINVFSPGGLGSVEKLEGVDFTRALVDALERKVQHAASRDRRFDNRELATLGFS